MNTKFIQLNNSIIKCKKCTRLINFAKKISKKKRKQNINDTYWGKPVPGFGDLKERKKENKKPYRNNKKNIFK